MSPRFARVFTYLLVNAERDFVMAKARSMLPAQTRRLELKSSLGLPGKP